jgi:hypothetical protein
VLAQSDKATVSGLITDTKSAVLVGAPEVHDRIGRVVGYPDITPVLVISGWR